MVLRRGFEKAVSRRCPERPLRRTPYQMSIQFSTVLGDFCAGLIKNDIMPTVPQSEIRVKKSTKNFKEIDEKCGDIFTKFFIDFRPSISRVAISVATYRGAKCPTLKTAEKQPKRVPSGSR